MTNIIQFLADPIVSLIGYALTVISSLIAIQQYFDKKEALNLNLTLQNKISTLELENSSIKQSNNKNTVTQGDHSQFINDNTGPISIDNRRG